MSWLQKLFETYEANINRHDSNTSRMPLLPVSHSIQQAHVEVVLDAEGYFKSATVLDTAKEIVIPVTEKSAGRTTSDAPHPLADKIQYVAKDYPIPFGGRKKSYFASYLKQLEAWCKAQPHPMSVAILNYVRRGTVVADLINAGVLCIDTKGILLTSRPDGIDTPRIFRVIPKDPTKKEGGKPVQDQGNAFVRWRVECPGNPSSNTWEDAGLMQSWAEFDSNAAAVNGLCMVTGKGAGALATMHPKRLRHGGDGARLISSNDETGYTFRGRVASPQQVASIASDVTQKAHSALRWLISRDQSFRNGDQVIVAWAVSGTPIPDPFADSASLFDDQANENTSSETAIGDVGQAFAKRLAKSLKGYRTTLGATEDIIVMGLDSATPGRMSVTFYRELTSSDLLEKLTNWHQGLAWCQCFSKQVHFWGAPSPKDIAGAAYGPRLDDKLLKATVERLLPCILDGRRLPRDVMECAIRRVSNRASSNKWEWEKSLGIACSLFRGFHTEREYLMSLESDRRTRDYLYGRLLALAEHIESRALHVAGEVRQTTAARLMQRFSHHPYSTWLTIENSLQPYMARLQAKRPEFLAWTKALMDELHCLFDTAQYIDDRPLSGEYLLGYHCQRNALWCAAEKAHNANDDSPLTNE